MTKKGLQCYWYKAYKRSLPLIVSSVVKRYNLATGTKMTIIGIRPFKRFVVRISKQFINKRIIEIVCPMIVVGLGKFVWIHQHYYSCPLNCNLLLFPEIFNSFNNIRKLTSLRHRVSPIPANKFPLLLHFCFYASICEINIHLFLFLFRSLDIISLKNDTALTVQIPTRGIVKLSTVKKEFRAKNCGWHMHVGLLYANFIEVTADSAQHTSSDRHVIDRIFDLSKFTPTHFLL